MSESLDVVETLRELGTELNDISVVVTGPYETVARIGAISFMLLWIADALDHEFRLAAERGKKMNGI